MKIGELESFIKSRETPAVINFWATWCGPCVEEMPWFNKIVPEYKNKNTELVFVSLDNERAFPQSIQAFVNQKQIKATFIWLDETDANVFCPRIDKKWEGSIPATIFINNKTGYRKFLETQLSPGELRKQLRFLNQPS